MSAIKRHLEELATIIANAIEIENSDPHECAPFEYGEVDNVEDAVFTALCDAQYDLIFCHLDGCWTECTAGCELEQRPLTFRAMVELMPMVSDKTLHDCMYTRSPTSLVDWEYYQ